jgi:hypothetical protein
MSRVFLHGVGAISPAGWGVEALISAVRAGVPLPAAPVAHPGRNRPLHIRPVPPPPEQLAFLNHPRLRRSSNVSQHVVGAALEALAEHTQGVQDGAQRLGIVICLMAGCVTYSRRFFEEVLRDPFTASPLLFPETVFNAPGSHLAAFLNSRLANYTLVGDDSTFLEGLALGARLLSDQQCDGVLVLGAQEADWLVADALRLFTRRAVPTGGAAALYLRREPSPTRVELSSITDPCTFDSVAARSEAAKKMRAQLPVEPGNTLLCLGTTGASRRDAAELDAWRDSADSRITPKHVLGEAFTASAGWQCVVACEMLTRASFTRANVSVVGANHQALGAQFRRLE